jgi:Ser/Thr protein kinase RdoA (MazF antagonist)
MMHEDSMHRAACSFEIAGSLLSAERYGSGHIHDSYCAAFEHAGAISRYLIQRINCNIFKQPAAVMENIQRVTGHLAAQLVHRPDRLRRVLTLVPSQDGQAYHRDADGQYWRAYRFIENTHTCDIAESPEQAYEAAKAFGQFQQLLATLAPPPLHETIPGFHNTPQRFAAFEQAIASDTAGRAADAGPEIEFASAHRHIARLLHDADLAIRTVHNDTKLNNVLLDNATGEGLCVIDLDTVMPGLALHDFGDMVRTMTSPAPEDERKLDRVTMRFSMFEALARGYLASAAGFLGKEELELLALSGKVITFEQGLRFLTDYLNGDVYYKVARPGHNLDRCRTQFRLVESIEQQEAAISRLVRSLTP